MAFSILVSKFVQITVSLINLFWDSILFLDSAWRNFALVLSVCFIGDCLVLLSLFPNIKLK